MPNKSTEPGATDPTKPFLTDVTELRRRARENIERGAVTEGYRGDVERVIGHDTTVYVAEAEAKALDTARTYLTFGWPFVILGVLLVASSRERRPVVEAAPESQNPWKARR